MKFVWRGFVWVVFMAVLLIVGAFFHATEIWIGITGVVIIISLLAWKNHWIFWLLGYTVLTIVLLLLSYLLLKWNMEQKTESLYLIKSDESTSIHEERESLTERKWKVVRETSSYTLVDTGRERPSISVCRVQNWNTSTGPKTIIDHSTQDGECIAVRKAYRQDERKNRPVYTFVLWMFQEI